MTEDNLFTKVATVQLYNDSIGAVSLYDASHANESEEQRIHTVTTLASLAYGNEEAKNPEALYKRMQSIKHESLWEFIVDTYPYCSITTSMRNSPDDYSVRYSNKDNVDAHKQNIACFRIKVPMFVRSQFMRHRSFSYLEMSRRYTKGSKVPFQFWFPEELRKNGAAITIIDNALNLYSDLCDTNETQVASRFLPQVTYTEFYMMGETEGLKNYFKLRLDSHAQAEIRELSAAMLELLQINQPALYNKVKP